MLKKKGDVFKKELALDKKPKKIVKSFRLSEKICEDFQEKCNKEEHSESYVLEKLMAWYLKEV